MTEAELIALNNDFYQKVAPFFAQTRQSAWAGWEKLVLPKNGASVLDVAAGNLRFYQFLQSKNLKVNYLALDACRPLLDLRASKEAQFLPLDLLEAMLNGKDWRQKLPQPQYDYVICNAFFHHIPNSEWREKMLRQLWELVAPKGTLSISFWQFMTDPNLAKRVQKDLGNNDFILDWKKGIVAERYCHHFDDQELEKIKELMSEQGAQLVEEFNADGATKKMNRYLGWQKLS